MYFYTLVISEIGHLKQEDQVKTRLKNIANKFKGQPGIYSEDVSK